MPTKEYKKNYCDLDKFEQSLCLGLFAIDYKLDHCNSEYIEEQFLKSDVCQDYVRKAQKLPLNWVGDSMTELKPCPFCGSKDLGIERKVLFYVTCYKCDCEGPATKDKQQAIDAWNKRS